MHLAKTAAPLKWAATEIDMSEFVLAHLSDPHLAPLPSPSPRELMNKRALGYYNWTRNRFAFHRRDVLDALIADVKAQAPDHIAITGDLVNLSLEAEFLQAEQWLRTVGPPQHVTLVPGNHDAYVPSMRNRFADVWADYMRGDHAPATGPARFPYLQRRGPLAIIGLSTAVPAPPFFATGRLGPDQLKKLDAMLGELAGPHCFRVVLVHHPLSSESKRWHKRLVDAPELIALLRRRSVDLVLHGHDHRHSQVWFDGVRGKYPAIGVPSASAADDGSHDPAAYNLFAISREDDSWRCDMRVRALVSNDGWKDVRSLRLI